MGLTVVLALAAHVSVAQTSSDFSPPPMVPSASTPAAQPSTTDPGPPPPTPPPEAPGTPPPPSLTPSNTPAPSPYGTPKPATDEKPPIEYGLMISEGLFGALTAAGVSLLPYFLLLKDFVESGSGGVFGNNFEVGAIVYAVLFAAIPLSTAQTEVSIANGSRWYYSETWPAALCGLAAEGAVLGIAYLAREGLTNPTTGHGPIANPVVLLTGTIAFTPLVQMVIINLFKSPRFGKAPGSGGSTALLNFREGKGVTAGVPSLAPVFNRDGAMSGAQFSLISGRW